MLVDGGTQGIPRSDRVCDAKDRRASGTAHSTSYLRMSVQLIPGVEGIVSYQKDERVPTSPLYLRSVLHQRDLSVDESLGCGSHDRGMGLS